MSELPKPPESQPPTSSDDWEDKKTPHTNRPVPKSWKWMLAISLVLTVCSSGVAVITYLDNSELARELEVLARELEVTEHEQLQTRMLLGKVAELEQQLTSAESSLKEQQLQSAKTSLNDATKNTQEIKQQLRLLAGGPPKAAGIVKSSSAWLRDWWHSTYDWAVSATK